MMRARNIFFVLPLLLPVSVDSALGQQISSASDDVLTLDQAIALALRENHAVRDAELEAGKSLDALAASRTNRLPSMNVYALATEQFVKPVGIGNIFPGVGDFFSIGLPRRPHAALLGL